MALVHGSMDRGASFARVMSELSDCHVLRYDRRGYGRSLDHGPPAGLDEHVDDLLVLLDGRPSVVVGHSFGGAVALAAADRHPDVVLAAGAFEAPLSWRPWWPNDTAGGRAVDQAEVEGPEAAAEAFLRRMAGHERWDALPGDVKRQRRQEGIALVTELASLRRSPPYEPDALSGPVVVGRGTRSEPYLQRAAEELAAEAPEAELIVIEGADHGAHLTHQAAFASLVRLALDRAIHRSTP